MREATDLGIGAAVRRELAGRRIDLSKIKFPVKAGVVTLQGELAFVGINKTADETAIELKFIESSLRQITGVKQLVFELAGWTKNDSGVWESELSSSALSAVAAGVSMSSSDGLYCDECDMVIRFCPCCGKPLAASTKGSGRPRRPALPVKPAIKKRPVFTPTTSSNLSGKKEPVSPVSGGMPASSPGNAAPFKPISPAPGTIKPLAPAKPAVDTAASGISTLTPDMTPATPKVPVAPAPIPSAERPVVPPAPAKPAAAAPVVPAKPVTTAHPSAPVAPTLKPAPAPIARPQTPAPAATPQKPVAPAPATRPVAPPVSKPAPVSSTPPVESSADAADDMNFDDLNLNLDVDNQTKPGLPAAKTTTHAEPRSDFRKSAALTDDLFGSLIDNLSQSDSESSSEQNESEDFSMPSEEAGRPADESVPDINLSSLDDFAAPEQASEDAADLLPPMKPAAAAAAPEPSFDEFADLLPPMKPAATTPEPALDEFADLLPPMKPKAPATPAARPKPAVKPAAPAAEPDPFAGLDDTPLPPMKPAGSDTLEDDDTPLPPMRAKTPAGKESKDPFAALFSESDLGLGGGSGGEGGKDPFASLDLDLDVLEVFPSDDQPAPPPAKHAPGGKKPAAAKPAAPADDNPFNIDNIIDLDSPVEEKPKAGQKKPAKDPFDLDDFDIGKFKL